MSAIPAALDAMVALFTAAAPGGLTVHDGPPADPGDNFLAVGHHDGQEVPVTADGDFADLTGSSDTESFDVVCLLTLWHSRKSLPSANRTELFSAFGLFVEAIRTHPDLDGAVTSALVTQKDYQQSIPEPGRMSALRFTVHCEAWS